MIEILGGAGGGLHLWIRGTLHVVLEEGEVRSGGGTGSWVESLVVGTERK